MNKETVEKNIILEAVAGSHAYGTSTPESDFDSRGICIPPKDYVIGLKHFEQYNPNNADRTIYNIKKYFKLALNCNPNVIELVWTPEDCATTITSLGKRLMESREIFSSKAAYKTFGGYAVAQLRKLTNKSPEGKRFADVAKYGYDPKHAMHCVRLLRAGIEFLSTGVMNVHREDADDLKDIRAGGREYSQIMGLAHDLLAELDDANASSCLPEQPDLEAANVLLIELVEEHWNAG